MSYTLRMLQVCSQAKFRCDWMHTRIRSHHWPAMRSRICPIQVSCHRYSFPCLSPFVYCSTAPIRLQIFPVPSKVLQIESLHPHKCLEFRFSDSWIYKSLRIAFRAFWNDSKPCRGRFYDCLTPCSRNESYFFSLSEHRACPCAIFLQYREA